MYTRNWFVLRKNKKNRIIVTSQFVHILYFVVCSLFEWFQWCVLNNSAVMTFKLPSNKHSEIIHKIHTMHIHADIHTGTPTLNFKHSWFSRSTNVVDNARKPSRGCTESRIPNKKRYIIYTHNKRHWHI